MKITLWADVHEYQFKSEGGALTSIWWQSKPPERPTGELVKVEFDLDPDKLYPPAQTVTDVTVSVESKP